MRFKPGAVLLIGLMIGMASAAVLQDIFQFKRATALQVTHCSKASKIIQ